jgi:hypothetical protein
VTIWKIKETHECDSENCFADALQKRNIHQHTSEFCTVIVKLMVILRIEAWLYREGDQRNET